MGRISANNGGYLPDGESYGWEWEDANQSDYPTVWAAIDNERIPSGRRIVVVRLPPDNGAFLLRGVSYGENTCL